MTLAKIREKYLEQWCYVYKPATDGGTVTGKCLDVTEHDWTFETGNGSVMTVPRGKYDVRIAKKTLIEEKTYARYKDTTRQP